MPSVEVVLNGRRYAIACADGQQRHVANVAKMVDSRMRELAADFAQADEVRLLVMTCLFMADELNAEAETRAARAREMADAIVAVGRRELREDGYQEGFDDGRADGLAEVAAVAEATEALAERVEAAAARLESGAAPEAIVASGVQS